ncbi:MAG: DsbA family protein [Bacteroidetes bacterium]|nr:DsbA family protein [Bacteroidota bacterium]
MALTLFYCFDAWCGWCYGFSPVVQKIAKRYADKIAFEALSGGMILPDTPTPLSASAGYILNAYPEVEARTGVRFSEDYLWHLRNPDLSDWFPHSEKSAIALSVFKEFYPSLQAEFVADLQHALFVEGRDLTDDEAYRHLLEKYGINHVAFYEKLHAEAFRDAAHQEFAMCKQLQVTGFPTLFLQVSDLRFYLIARGYATEEQLIEIIDRLINEFDQVA